MVAFLSFALGDSRDGGDAIPRRFCVYRLDLGMYLRTKRGYSAQRSSALVKKRVARNRRCAYVVLTSSRQATMRGPVFLARTGPQFFRGRFWKIRAITRAWPADHGAPGHPGSTPRDPLRASVNPRHCVSPEPSGARLR